METADLIIHHVFRLHGIPHNIVSDQGPQFTSQVWWAFCQGIGATADREGEPTPGNLPALYCHLKHIILEFSFPLN